MIPAMVLSWLARRWKRLLAVLLSLFIAAVVASHWIVGPLLLGQIQALLRDRLNARFTAANIWYFPPYTLIAYDCRLSDLREPAAGDLLQVAEIRLSLDRFPTPGQPWRFDEIQIHQPTLHVVQTAGGIAGFEKLLPSLTAATEPTTAQARTRRKISDLLQIQHFSLTDCKFIYTDASAAGASSSWEGPSLNIQAAALGPAVYSYIFSVAGATPVEIHASGTANLDDRQASVDAFEVTADVGYPDSSPLPPSIANLLAQNRAQGLLSAQGSGQINARDFAKSGFSADWVLLNASGLRADGDIQLSSSVLIVNTSSGRFGADQFSFTASLPASSWPTGIIQCNNINASIDFHPPSPVYPDPLDNVFAQIRPSGLYHINGFATQNFRADGLQYDLLITTGGGGATIVSRNIQLTQAQLDSELFPDHLNITTLDCDGLGGKLTGSGSVVCRRPYNFTGKIDAGGMDLSQIAQLLGASQRDLAKFQGKVRVQGTFGGAGPHDGKSAADLFVADGQFQIDQGNFWDIPTLAAITSRLAIARKALTVSQADGKFQASQKQVNLSEAELSAPLLGMQGSGTVDFDGQLDLDVVAAPLADWQDKIDKTGVPIVSDVAGTIADKVQSIFNKTTSNLLYKFHVTGSASDPRVTTIAAPALTQGAERLFGRLLPKSAPQSVPASNPATTKSSTQSVGE